MRTIIIAALAIACGKPHDSADTADIQCATAYDDGCDDGTRDGLHCDNDTPDPARTADECYLDGYVECADAAQRSLGEQC